MRLESFSVENYRSITQARKVSLSENTVLIGPNNEGKSNILRALSAGMYALVRHQTGGVRPGEAARVSRGPDRDKVYRWERDFPVSMQRRPAGRVTKIVLDFALNAEEVEEFSQEIKSKLNGSLPVCVSFSESDVEIKIVKQGKGSAGLNAKSEKIAQFLAKRIQFQYIPAVRTAQFASSIVEEIVASELRDLERNEEFKDAIAAIRNLQRPILDKFSERVSKTLAAFLPGIKSVKFDVNDERRYLALRHNIDITVDDGTITSLDSKGDGIQSIVALGLRRHAVEETREKSSYIFAIEEPESHLHPDAVHELRSVIADIGSVDQTILTTHSPLLVNRSSISSNFIVNRSTAVPARRLSEIRAAIGVRSYDNLVNADVVLLVEGEGDRIALRAILADRSTVLLSAIDQGRLNIESLDGAGALGAKIGLFRGILCSVHCLLDADNSGKAAVEKAKAAGDEDVNLTIVPGKDESEFEDIIEHGFSRQVILSTFGVDIDVHKPRSGKLKWSARLGDSFLQCGAPFDASTKARAKWALAQAVAASPASAIATPFEGIVSSVVTRLELKLAQAG